MRLQHDIFNRPLKVDVPLIEIETPSNYASWFDGRDLPKTLQAWQVQTRDFPEIDVGLVSDPYGFSDAPGTEWISGGVNSKSPNSLALGRHGNYFFWGFFASPPDLTETAQQVFVNTVCYMKQFDGCPPQAGRQGSSRDWARVYAGYVRDLASSEDNRGFLVGLFPKEVIEEVGLDADKLDAYYRDNLEFLIPSQGSGFEVDSELRDLGLSNRTLEVLDFVADALVEDPEDSQAHGIIRRYVDDRGMSAAAYASWLKENRNFLYFADLAGYRWQIDGAAKAASASAGSK